MIIQNTNGSSNSSCKDKEIGVNLYVYFSINDGKGLSMTHA